MAGTSESGQQWERTAAELRAYRDAQRRAWGDLDDMVLARYLAGEASPEERNEVERAMRERPDVAEAVQVLREVLGAEADGPATIPFAAAAATAPAAPIRKGFAARWVASAAVGGLAAGLALGFAAAWWGLAQRTAGDFLVASVTPVPREQLGAADGKIVVDPQGTFQVPRDHGFGVAFRSPRAGSGAVVRLSPGKYKVWPAEGEEIKVKAGTDQPYGPIQVEQPGRILIFVTPSPPADALRHALGAGRAEEDTEAVKTRLTEALRRENSWVVVGEVRVKPAPE